MLADKMKKIVKVLTEEEQIQPELFNALALIDDSFSKQELSIPLRPLLAATTFVEKFLVQVGEDDNPTDDYLRKPWFAYIVEMTNSWYEMKYGDSLKPGSIEKKA
ncbi:MAG: hypothetical protein ACTSWQ_10700, partial [Candidatus Thorarchaeota archaeon]